MKRVIVITVLLVASSGAAFAQSTSQTVSLADVARAEEARRKTAKKATKVLTNYELDARLESSIPASPSPQPPAASGATNATPGVPTTNIPGGKVEEPAPVKGDQAFWAGRMSKARTDLSRTQMFADSLQTQINSLRTDFVNRDEPRRSGQRFSRTVKTALAELERLKKEMDDADQGDRGDRRRGAPCRRAIWLAAAA